MSIIKLCFKTYKYIMDFVKIRERSDLVGMARSGMTLHRGAGAELEFSFNKSQIPPTHRPYGLW